MWHAQQHARGRVVGLCLVLAACGAGASETIPFANAPGSIYAPLYSPPPSPRGIAPTILSAQTGGIVCNDMRLTGKRIGAIKGKLPGCGVSAPVRVTSIAGVTLSSPVRLNCRTASAFADWTEQHAKPEATKLMGARLVKIYQTCCTPYASGFRRAVQGMCMTA